jgi:hypothetical protein
MEISREENDTLMYKGLGMADMAIEQARLLEEVN